MPRTKLSRVIAPLTLLLPLLGCGAKSAAPPVVKRQAGVAAEPMTSTARALRYCSILELDDVAALRSGLANLDTNARASLERAVSSDLERSLQTVLRGLHVPADRCPPHDLAEGLVHKGVLQTSPVCQDALAESLGAEPGNRAPTEPTPFAAALVLAHWDLDRIHREPIRFARLVDTVPALISIARTESRLRPERTAPTDILLAVAEEHAIPSAAISRVSCRSGDDGEPFRPLRLDDIIRGHGTAAKPTERILEKEESSIQAAAKFCAHWVPPASVDTDAFFECEGQAVAALTFLRLDPKSPEDGLSRALRVIAGSRREEPERIANKLRVTDDRLRNLQGSVDALAQLVRDVEATDQRSSIAPAHDEATCRAHPGRVVAARQRCLNKRFDLDSPISCSGAPSSRYVLGRIHGLAGATRVRFQTEDICAPGRDFEMDFLPAEPFPTCSSELRAMNLLAVETLAKAILEWAPTSVQVIGHSDDRPLSSLDCKTYNDNQDLSFRRALSVTEALRRTLQRLPGEGRNVALQPIGYGSIEPLIPHCDDGDELCHSANRRFTIRVIGGHLNLSSTCATPPAGVCQ